MRLSPCFASALLCLSLPCLASVNVSSPANGATVSSPVAFTATASAPTCSKGVAAMGIYVNNQLTYQQNASSISTSLTLAPGTYQTVIQAWDNCGGASSTPVNIIIPGAGPTGVAVSAPSNNATVTSPVTYSAKAVTNSCAKGIAAMGVYVGGSLAYQVNGATLSTSLALPAGSQSTVVQAWDNCGGSLMTPINLTVQSTATSVSVTGSPASIASGSSTTLTVSAANATQVTLSGSDGSSFTLAKTGGTEMVSPLATTTYTATATGATGNVTSAATITVTAPAPAVTLVASPASIAGGASSTLTLTASNATTVKVTGSDGSSYTLKANGGTQTVTPTATTTYTATASGTGGSATSSASITVSSATGLQSLQHVIFMLQENHSFDNYFGMLNPYRAANGFSTGADGKTYSVDGIDDKLTKIANQDDEGASFPPFKFKSTCVEDLTSSWLESYGDVSRWDFSSSRAINIDGFVHTAENFAKNCKATNGTGCSGTFSDFTGQRSMGYYDQGFLNYYYYMASQFALSDRWFSPISSKSTPNRIATFTGGTTGGLAFDPGSDDHLPQLTDATIFAELSANSVPWKIYYTVTQGACTDPDECSGGASSQYPATDFTYFTDSYKYLYENPNGAACTAPTQASSVVGDKSNSFCIDPTHIAPLKQYYTDLANGTLPSFAFIEAGYGVNDEHPGSGQSILSGQQEVSKIVNALMASTSWKQSAFFMAYDEGGGPYDHVPPVQGHSNDATDAMVGSASLGSYPDISSIAVNADSYFPCLPPSGVATLNCDLNKGNPGALSSDAAAAEGFSAQLGFRVPNLVVSPFVRKHYVSHIPMDHTAILKFVENRFIGPNAHLTARDAAQPGLLDFFDFANVPWSTPPTPPAPVTPASLGYDPCTPTKFTP